jgi:hypothetical protein
MAALVPRAVGNRHDVFVQRRVSMMVEPRRSSWSAADLLAHDFPEPRWAVPGIVAEGLTVLAGPPKVGKSWFALNLAVAIASGSRALGRVEIERGEVLYFSLEDPPRRLKRRLEVVLQGEPAPPSRLIFETECRRLPAGGNVLRTTLKSLTEPRLAIIDVFARVRPRTSERSSLYDNDYEAVSSLKAIADAFEVPVLLVHHTRKAAADDYLNTVSGSHGIAGAADAVLVLARSRGSADAVLQVTGRDVEEANHALAFAPHLGAWTMLDGPADDYTLGDTRRRILQHVRDQGACTPTTSAKALGLNLNTAKGTLRRMANDGQLDTDNKGHYFEPLQPVTPETPQPSELQSYAGYGLHDQDVSA